MRASGTALVVALLMVAAPTGAGPRGLPPGDLWAAQTGANVVTLVWSRPDRASEFRIFVWDGGALMQISAPRASATSFTHSVRPPLGVRRYEIEAVFQDGTVSERAVFNEIRVERVKAGPVGAPASVTAEQTGPVEITVRWSEVPEATAFVIGRTVGAGGLQVLCRLCPTTGRYIDRSPEPGAPHAYSVMTVSAHGTSRRAMSNSLVPATAPAPR